MKVYVLYDEVGWQDENGYAEKQVIGIVTDKAMAGLWQLCREGFDATEEFELDDFNILEHLDRRTRIYRTIKEGLNAKAENS